MESLVLALLGLAVALGAIALGILLPVLAWVRTRQAVRTAERALARVEELAREVKHLRDLAGAREARGANGSESTRAASVGTTPFATAAAAAQPPARDADATGPTGLAHGPDAAVQAASSMPAAFAPSLGEEPPTSGSEASVAPPPSPAVAADGAAGPVSATAAMTSPRETPASLEQRIGQRWLLYAGVSALVLGASYVVKLAFDAGWITPAMRLLLSAAGGLLLVLLGVRFATRGLAFFGSGLAGTGVAILYLVIYAALEVYGLLNRRTAFLGMGLTTMLAAAIADRRAAQPLAFIALVGGFATPVLVGGDPAAHVGLFTYLTLVMAGALWLARRHAWPLVTLLTLVLITFTFSAWAVTEYRAGRYLSVQVFLTLWLGLLLGAVAPRTGRPVAGDAVAGRGSEDATAAGVTAIVGVLAPLLYHLASVANLQRHALAFFIYLIVATLCGMLYTADGRRPWARLVIWIAVWLPLLGWLSTRGRPAGALPTVIAVYGLHLSSELRALLRDRTNIVPLDTVLLHLNGLALVAALLLLRPSWDTGGMAVTVALVGLFYLLLAPGLWRVHARAPAHHLALAAACLAGALALRFEGTWVTLGWAVEGTLIVWLGLRDRRGWLRAGGWLLVGLAVLHGLQELARPASVGMTPFLNARALSLWAIAALLGWLASRYASAPDAPPAARRRAIAVAVVAACALALVVLSEQVNGAFGRYAWQRDTTAGPMAAGAADLARQVTISLVWAGYAVALIVIGIARRFPPLRYLAIVILVGTMAKVFVVDLAQLDRFYRVASVIGLGICLIVASWLYQRHAGTATTTAGAPPGP